MIVRTHNAFISDLREAVLSCLFPLVLSGKVELLALGRQTAPLIAYYLGLHCVQVQPQARTSLYSVPSKVSSLGENFRAPLWPPSPLEQNLHTIASELGWNSGPASWGACQ